MQLWASFMSRCSTSVQQVLTSLHACLPAGLLRRSLELFLQFPFNSILHHQVTSILCVALDSAGPELLRHLFHDCQLEQWLVTAPVMVLPLPRPGDPRQAYLHGCTRDCHGPIGLQSLPT